MKTEFTRDEIIEILKDDTKNDWLFSLADEVRKQYVGDEIHLRALIEYTNICKNACKYCGLRCENRELERYRLTPEEIIDQAYNAVDMGFKTVVLQGGEDAFYTDEKMIDIIKAIKAEFPNNAITLSIGERSYESYEKLYKAGADRFLLRHESATKSLYESIHNTESFEERRSCLKNLKEIGFQAGAGFMVGLPNQTNENIVDDLMYVKELEPAMCGIGPFIPHKDTPFREFEAGTTEKTVILLAITRLLLPKVLLPATTALASIDANGRNEGLRAGANVIMPNLSPMDVRKKYSLYNNKAFILDEDAEYRKSIEAKLNEAGFVLEEGRGDKPDWR